MFDDDQKQELAFHVAELVAQFVLAEAARLEHVGQVHDALVEIATKIRTADWVPDDDALLGGAR